jgi:hypothetical protein
MTKIQNSKQLIFPQLCPAASSLPDQGLRSDATQQWRMFWSLNIDPPKAERFICNLVLEIWNFSVL